MTSIAETLERRRNEDSSLIETKGIKETKTGEKLYIYSLSDTSSLHSEIKQAIAREMERVSEGLINSEHILAQFEANTYNLFFALSEQGQMVGYATVFPKEKKGFVYLNKVQVFSKERNKGIATIILRQIMESSSYISLINIVSSPEVKEAMARLYLNLGFQTQDNISFNWESDQ